MRLQNFSSLLIIARGVLSARRLGPTYQGLGLLTFPSGPAYTSAGIWRHFPFSFFPFELQLSSLKPPFFDLLELPLPEAGGYTRFDGPPLDPISIF